MTVAAAQAAVAAALTAAMPDVDVVDGSLDRLGARPALTVEASTSTRRPSRLLVDVSVTALVRAATPNAANRLLVELTDRARAVVEGMRTVSGVHWMGPSTDLTVSAVEADEGDGARTAAMVLDAQMAVPAVPVREVGPSEQAVRDVLAAAGVDVVDGSDVPPMVVTRWAGTSAGDPHRDDILVVCAAELESGDIEALARRVRTALDAAGSGVVVEGRTDVDLAGAPPGSDAGYEVAAMTATVLRGGDRAG